MSDIRRNGILAEECYQGKQVSIEERELRSMNDFLVRDHMLKMAGLRAKNLPDVYKWLKMLRQVDYSEEEFLERFS